MLDPEKTFSWKASKSAPDENDLKKVLRENSVKRLETKFFGSSSIVAMLLLWKVPKGKLLIRHNTYKILKSTQSGRDFTNSLWGKTLSDKDATCKFSTSEIKIHNFRQKQENTKNCCLPKLLTGQLQKPH